MKKTVFGLMLTLLLVGISMLAFKVQPVKASGTIYIKGDGSVVGTDKIQRDGNVYTFTDNINDSIVVEKDNIVLDGAGYTLQGPGLDGIMLYGRSNVTIKDMTIKAFSYGIYLYSSSDNNRIVGNNITENHYYGISLDGISLESSPNNNTIVGNNITNNSKYGIWLSSSPNNFFRNNAMSGNLYNFVVDGSTLSDFFNYVDVSNTVDGKPIYYLINQTNLIINSSIYPNIGYLALINSTNITVEGLEPKNNGQGILLAYTNNSQITNNRITNNEHGIRLSSSFNNSVVGNNITENHYYGIELDSSSNNSIVGNNIRDNAGSIELDHSSNYNSISGNSITNGGDGISLFDYSSYNSIVGNNITNKIAGIRLYSSYNSIVGNNITNNRDGIWLYESSNNIIAENNVTNNDDGIYLYSSSNNKFYHNNFTNNAQQVLSAAWNLPEDFVPSVNVWDDGYPSGGNCWSDYRGVDVKSGSNQDQQGRDGIGDTPYTIDTNNRDRYPLMTPHTAPESPSFPVTTLFATIILVIMITIAAVRVFRKKRP